MKKESVFAGNYEGPLYAPHPDLKERADTWHPDPEKDRKLGGPGANQRAREDVPLPLKSLLVVRSQTLKNLQGRILWIKRQKAGKSASAPKPKERKDKIARKLGNLVDRIGKSKKKSV